MTRRPLPLLLAALGTSVTAALVWAIAVHVGPAHWLDATILDGFTGLDGARVHPIASDIARLCDPQPFVWWSAIIVLVALYRRRPRSAAAAAVILAGANVTTQVLKPALATHRFSTVLEHVGQVNSASWPSGHATASMSLALCGILVAAPRWRPWVAAAGAVFTVAVVFSFLTLEWHYPSDVLGGFLVASTWTLVAVAGLAWAQQRWPQRREPAPGGPRVIEALAPTVVAAVAALGLLALVLLARPQQVVDYAQEHSTFVVGAGVIGTLALAIAAAFALVLRNSRR